MTEEELEEETLEVGSDEEEMDGDALKPEEEGFIKCYEEESEDKEKDDEVQC